MAADKMILFIMSLYTVNHEYLLLTFYLFCTVFCPTRQYNGCSLSLVWKIISIWSKLYNIS